MVGPLHAHRFRNLGDKTHPVLLGAAILIRTLVGFLRQEFVHEIAVGAVQLQHVEAGLMRAPRRFAPGLHQVFHLMALQRAGHRPFLAVRNRARRHRRPLLQSSISGVRCSGRSPSVGRDGNEIVLIG
jgi:hypothetical protein